MIACAADEIVLGKHSFLSPTDPQIPDLLVQSETALDMSRELVKMWLETYMFKGMNDRDKRARSVSKWLSNHKNFKSHSRHVSRTDLEAHQMSIFRLENDVNLQDFSLSVFHATTHTFTGTPAVKIVENHTGRAFIKQHIQVGIGSEKPQRSGRP